MIDWLYRFLYRREIRERQERMAAHAAVWRQRQIVNDAKQRAATADLKSWGEELRAAATDEEFQAVLKRTPGQGVT